MLPLLLLHLRDVNWWRAAVVAAVAAIVLLALQVWQGNIDLAQARVAYANPKTSTVVKTVKVEGPVRIVTRVVKEPGGREETTTEETRGAVTTSTGSEVKSEPVFAAAPRLDRWLVGVGVEPFHWGERGTTSFHAGYSFSNRLDLCAGITHDRRAELLFTVRF